MKQVEEIAKKVLVEEEELLRNEIMAFAKKHDYASIVYNENYKIMGHVVNYGRNNRWLNIMRMLSIGDFRLHYLQTQLDMHTIQKIHKALP